MSTHPIIEILNRWPNRQAIADDAGVDLFAVHRWYQRKSVNGSHDTALIKGAAKRKIKITAIELAAARSSHSERVGHAAAQHQALPAKKRRSVA